MIPNAEYDIPWQVRIHIDRPSKWVETEIDGLIGTSVMTLEVSRLSATFCFGSSTKMYNRDAIMFLHLLFRLPNYSSLDAIS